MVRFPFVLGKDDYTKRLYFYVEHVLGGKPMSIDNIDCPMGFILSREAGAFLAFLAGNPLAGPVNASSEGVLPLREMIAYVEQKSGKTAVLDPQGDPAPYNGTPPYSLSLCKAKDAGFAFTDIHEWIYGLLDFYCDAYLQSAART